MQVQPTGSSSNNASYPRVDAYKTYASQQLAVVAPGTATGGLTLSTSCRSVDVFADVEGYYLANTDGSQGDVYVPVNKPTRVIDTRQNLGVRDRIAPGRIVSGASAVPVVGVGGVPANATAVALSVGTTNGTSKGSNTIWTDGTPQPQNISTVNVAPDLIESNLAFVGTGPNGRVDVAATSADPTETNDLSADIEGYFYHSGMTDKNFGTPQYLSAMNGDTYYNTGRRPGPHIVTSNDTRGVDHDCISHQSEDLGSDIGIFDVAGDDPGNLSVSTINCMRSFGLGRRHQPGPVAPGRPAASPASGDRSTWPSRGNCGCDAGPESTGCSRPSTPASSIDRRRHDLDEPLGVTSPRRRGARRGSPAAPVPGDVPVEISQHRSSSSTDRATPQHRSTAATSTCTRCRPTATPTTATSCTWRGCRWARSRRPGVAVLPRHGRRHTATNGRARPAGATRMIQARGGLSQPAIQYVPTLQGGT